jgi:hypothetical protein
MSLLTGGLLAWTGHFWPALAFFYLVLFLAFRWLRESR